MGLLRCFPRPEPVAIAGETYLASGLRLPDLAALEAWAAARAASPLADLDALDPAAAEYPDALRAAYRRAEAEGWPPELGSTEVDRLVFETVEGRTLFLLLVLRDDPRRPDETGCAGLASAASPGEWRDLDRIAFSLDRSPLPEISRRIDRHLGLPEFEPARANVARISWEKAVAEVCAGDPARLLALRELTIGQWHLLRSGGAQAERFDPLPADPELEDQVGLARWTFWDQAIAETETETGTEGESGG